VPQPSDPFCVQLAYGLERATLACCLVCPRQRALRASRVPALGGRSGCWPR